ncbi:N-acetylmuramic acid 6-phosphate etherase [Alphaproteobacteria bacterium]|nr:N-acetylmuramic acid 6-phosphate etherase [Alphaproteobacteria bacterium]
MKKNIPKTEQIYKKSKPIDHLSVSDGILLMANEQKKAAIEVRKASKAIEFAINQIYKHLILSANGRLIYTGAGTSGRVGLQDGVELFPTFNWPKKRLDYIVAGGKKAIFRAVENAEDNISDAIKVTQKKSISSQDVVIGLAASGNTPFTCAVLEEANKNNALTVAISNNPDGKLLEFGKCKIILDTKEELISGSTRLKAGTAQKICLNIISSMVMIKFGKIKNGLMVDMIPTNKKLRHRKSIIDAETI